MLQVVCNQKSITTFILPDTYCICLAALLEILLNWMDFDDNGFNEDASPHFYTQESKVLYMTKNKIGRLYNFFHSQGQLKRK